MKTTIACALVLCIVMSQCHSKLPNIISHGDGLFYHFSSSSPQVKIYTSTTSLQSQFELPFGPESVKVVPGTRQLAVIGTNRTRVRELVLYDVCEEKVVKRKELSRNGNIVLVDPQYIYVNYPDDLDTCITRYDVLSLSSINGSACISGTAKMLGTLNRPQSAIFTGGYDGLSITSLDLKSFTFWPQQKALTGTLLYAGGENIITYDGVDKITTYKVEPSNSVIQEDINVIAESSLDLTGGIKVLKPDLCNTGFVNIIGYSDDSGSFISLFRVDLATGLLVNQDPVKIDLQTLSVSEELMQMIEISFSSVPIAASVSSNTLFLSNLDNQVFSVDLSNGDLRSIDGFKQKLSSRLSGNGRCTNHVCST
ncbi:hypothetical protein AKO1_011468 [Acrasis kona]|uniref:Uncharacterized protein n=1 Tax=Acrasis kona TaxID=1008807 RepID=A0AAW2Z2E4_9EUKA